MADCDGLTGEVTITAILFRDPEPVHAVSEGSCVDPGMPWLVLHPVNCMYREPVPWEWWVYVVAIVLPAIFGLLILFLAYYACRYLADNPSPWTCVCRLICWAACNYGVNAKVHPGPPPKEEEEEKQYYRAKKYRRQTTAELAGELSADEIEARGRLKEEAVAMQKKRRNTLAHVGSMPAFSGAAPIQRAPDPTQNFTAMRSPLRKPLSLEPNEVDETASDASLLSGKSIVQQDATKLTLDQIKLGGECRSRKHRTQHSDWCYR